MKSFVSLHQAASLLPSGHTQAPRRIIPGMVILLIQDPIKVLLYRHVIITIQDETTMTGIMLRATILEVAKATDPLRGRIRVAYRGPGSSQPQFSRSNYHNQSRDPRQHQDNRHHGPPCRVSINACTTDIIWITQVQSQL